MSNWPTPVSLSPDGQEALFAAVRLAKAEEIQSVDTLRSRLKNAFSFNDDVIEEALLCWANRIVATQAFS